MNCTERKNQKTLKNERKGIMQLKLKNNKSHHTYRMSQNFRPPCPAVSITFALSESLKIINKSIIQE